jgi:hypothetical protein
MHLFEGECCSFLAAASKSNALAPHGFVRISNLMAFDWFHPDSGLGLSGVSGRRGRCPGSPAGTARTRKRVKAEVLGGLSARNSARLATLI